MNEYGTLVGWYEGGVGVARYAETRCTIACLSTTNHTLHPLGLNRTPAVRNWILTAWLSGAMRCHQLNSALSSFSWAHAGSSVGYTACCVWDVMPPQLSLFPPFWRAILSATRHWSLHPHFRIHTIRSALLTVYSERIRNKRQEFVSHSCLLLCIKNEPDEYWLRTLECVSLEGESMRMTVTWNNRTK